MDNICDFCGQARAGIMFEVRNEKGEREKRRICFDCIAKYAYAEDVSDINRVDEDSAELPIQKE